ncbi:MAG: vitamin K epoxide reductase family protein [Gemmatimonadota bacterium]
MKRRSRITERLLLLALASATLGLHGAVQPPVVRAVLFFSPTCPHCHTVIQQQLPVIFNEYGGQASVLFDRSLPVEEVAFYDVSNGQLEVLLVDISLPAGGELYNASTDRYNIPEDRRGVPRLVIGDTVFVGSVEIPTHLPRLIEQGLAGGGIDWPDIEGLQAAVASVPGLPLAAAEPEPKRAEEDVAEAAPVAEAPEFEADVEPESAPESEPEPELEPELEIVSEPSGLATEARPPAFDVIPERKPTMIENYRRDPVANGISVILLIGMLLSIVAVAYLWRLPSAGRDFGLAVPAISLVGIVVATYLAYIETTGATAVCGPVGDCNTVQQSEYAVLFGVPIGVLGLAGYVLIIGAWFVSRLDSGSAADRAKVLLLAMSAAGTIFSIYLTFLEPFVIGATCAWCLTSAVVMTVLMWLSVGPASEAWARLRGSRSAASASTPSPGGSSA